MGREIRRVPPNWEHPKDERDGGYIPMYDEDFDTALAEWVTGYELWKKREHPDYNQDDYERYQYWEMESKPPDPESYRPKFETEPTWYQVYETVSEGTPVTPPFATKEELVNYLVEHGDFWDQRRRHGGWSRDNAERFVNIGWAPSLVTVVSRDGVEIKSPRDGIV
jgi:hypothetical protein